jgi:citrate/tricarballylate utilization protein
MERSASFAERDLRHLANLCHNCAECYYACQYAPPHEFSVNLPKTLAEIRLESYRHYAWPSPFGGAFRKNGAIVSVISMLGLCVAIFVAARLLRPASAADFYADFYAVVPHEAMVAMFGAVSAFVALVLVIGALRCWRESGGGSFRFAPLKTALGDVLRLKYLSSGGFGCTYPNEHHSQARRWFHHFTFYGFGLCFASTSVAALYHYGLGWSAPYGYFSVPVMLGSLGGCALLIGPVGLYRLQRRHDRAITDARQSGMDVAFLALLFFTSLTGLLLLVMREGRAMPALLAIHLAVVMALFVSLPYGKFVHGIYRSLALLRDAVERAKVIYHI